MKNVYFNLNQMQHPCRRTMVGWTGTPSEDREMTVKRNRRTEECPVDSQGVSAPREFAEQTQNSSKPRRPSENREVGEPRECGLTHDHHGTISYAQPNHTSTQPWRESGARVAKYVAMIFAVLIMCIGQAWGTETTVTFISENKNDAGIAFAAMTNGDTQLVGSGLAKLIATNSVALSTNANKYGYRCDGSKLYIVFKFDGITDLSIQHNANSTGERYMRLYSFTSSKALSDITASDWSTKTQKAFSSTNSTTTWGGGQTSAVSTNNDKTTWNYTTKGCLVVNWEDLPAGYYVLDGTGSEAYIYSFTADVESGGGATSHNVSAVTSTGTNTYGTVSAAASSVAEGGTTTITAVPASGYRVTNWTVSGTGASISPSGASNANSTTLTMGTADATVTVTFGAIPTHSVTVTSNNGSYGTAAAGSATVAEGGTTTITATPNSGYKFDHWTVSGTGATLSSTSTNPTTLTMGTADATVTAYFDEKTCPTSGTLYSAAVKSSVSSNQSFPASATTEVSTSTQADITGGQLFAINGESSAKNLITNSSGYKFCMTNNSTKFKLVLECELQAGDIITIDGVGGTKNDAPIGLWVSSSDSRPGSAPACSGTSTTTSLVDDIVNYTVTSSDEYHGKSILYIHRAVGSSTYFNNISISRPEPPTPKRIYMVCGSTWCDASPKFFAYSWGGSAANSVELSESCADGVYYADIPADNTSVIFTRQAPSSTELVWTGDKFWNQSEDITIGANDMFTCTGWSDNKGTFSSGTYSAPTFSVTYNGNGSTGGSVPTDDNSYTCGDDATVLGVGTLVKAGYSFNGWNTEANGSGTPYAAGATISDLSANVTLYAQWTQEVPSTATVSGTWRLFPGQDISLGLETTGGTSDFTYQWQKEISSVWTDIEGATSSTYTKAGCTTADCGNYHCVVSKAGGSVNSDAFGVKIYTLNGAYDDGEFSSNDITVTSGTTGVATVHLEAGRVYKFKVTDNSGTWFGNSGRILEPTSSWAFASDNSESCILFTGPEGDYTFTVDIDHVTYGTPEVVVSVAYPEVTHPAEGYAYFMNKEDWTNVGLYMWYEGGSSYTTWEAVPWITRTTTICNNTYYYTPLIPSWYNRVIFRQVEGSGQSNNITISNLATYSGKYNDMDDDAFHEFGTYTITFAGNGNTGGTMAVINGICPNSNQVLPANAYEKTDKTFKGWIANVAVKVGDETVTAGTLIDDEATIQDIAGDITLTAQWCDPLNAPSGLQCSNQTRNSARLSWDGLGTSEDYEIKLESAGGAGTFGWTACTENICDATGLTRNTEYTFRVRRHRATGYCTEYSDDISVNFVTTAAYGITNGNPANGTITIGAAEALEGATVNITAEAASGYQFSAWSIYKTGDAETTVTPAAATASTSFTMPDYDVTVSATFVVQTYSVSYAGNGNTGGTVPTDDTGYTSGSTVTVEAGVPTKTGSTFVGWLNSVDNTIYKAGQSFTITAATTLTAVWESNGVTVTLTHFQTSSSSKSNNKPDDAGYYFYGYKGSVSDANAVTLTTNNSNTKGINSNVDLQLKYNSYMRIYSNNTTTGGTPTTFSNITAISLKIKLRKKLTTISISIGGTSVTSEIDLSEASTSEYTLYSFNNLSNLSGIITITNTAPSGSGDYDIYVDDISITTKENVGYTVTFDKGGQDGATGMPANIVGVPSGKKIATPLETPTADGYSFNGWVTTSGGSTPFVFANTTITGNTTIYAKWIELPASTTPVLPSLSDTEECDADDFTTWNATPTNASAISAAGESVAYSWKNSSDVEVATTATYQAEAAGTYTVTVTVSKAGQKNTAVTSSALTATLNTAAEKTGEPANVTAAANESFTISGLTVTNATGYQWYSCNSIGGSKSLLLDKTDATLTDTKAEVGVYYYICTIGNACGDDIDSRVVTVNVYTPIDPTLTYSSTTLYAEPVATTATPTVTGNTGSGKCSYSSSNTEVVTVDAETGLVTAVAVGTATITVTIAASGGYAAGSAACDVNVAGCSYSEIAGVTLTGATTADETNATLIANNLQASSPGYKLNGNGAKFGMQITGSFQVGDVINIKGTMDSSPTETTFAVYSSETASAANLIYSTTLAASATIDVDIEVTSDNITALNTSKKVVVVRIKDNPSEGQFNQNPHMEGMYLKRASCTGNIAEFTGGGEDSNWNDGANWAGGKTPTNKDRVVITNNMTVDVTTAQAKEIILDQEAGGTLTINAGQALVVAGTIQKWNGSAFVPTTAADLAIGSSADGNGTLIFENDDNAATVEMYSIGSTDGWKWQYIGVPFDGANAQATYYGAYLYKWNNGWTAVQKSDELEMFAGYCISYPAANYKYVMDGALAPTTEQSITVQAGKSMVIGNSWTAPIQISQMTAEDFTNVDQTVYLYNTGNDESGTAGTNEEDRYAAGTYVPVPIAETATVGVTKVSSLQGFFVKNNSGSAGTLSLSYSKHVRPSGGNSVVNGAMHAPKRVADETDRPAVLKMKVSGSQYDDRLILLEREDFTTGYDAGHDGEKIGDVATSPRITTTREDGTADAVAALPDLEGTLIKFRAASTDDQYTLYFDYETEDAEPLYLLDLTNNAYTRVVTGGSYTFVTTDKADHKRFALTRYRAPQITTDVEEAQGDNGQGKAVKFIENDKLYILRNGVLYDGTGKKVIEN